eukprot:TRINITY_DN3270_c0_g1_i2.p1 TRINITY_DN3270_c0_g1~~TRINITY_DN3270_c0_g1_i2.p1  ORF type:complete len:209 (-),score=50.03 TRINITY_DN3270_c0_g1_i2:147-773(-)
MYLNPLDPQHVIEVNKVEAEFWKKNSGERKNFSDKILGFDCGGEQWVSEVAFPTGTLANPTGSDINYVMELLKLITEKKIPAPCPIEQRWTSRSTALLSPAHSDQVDMVFSWVGIIMYLPPGELEQRKLISKRFSEYVRICEEKLWPKYGAKLHWAKLELPEEGGEKKKFMKWLRNCYDFEKFKSLRKIYDPNEILSNGLLQEILKDE